ncbi:MAG: bifunctional oligoribonuclease/PAP phosphatase NrnA [Acidobacteriota bacterium]
MIDWGAMGRKIEAALAEKKSIVLATHVNADGDGLGSEIGLYFFLKDRGHDVVMINNDPVPRKYAFLRGSDAVKVYDPDVDARRLRQAGLFFVLDNSSPERLGRLLPDLKASHAYKICIDHHAESDPFWDLNCVDASASASGQLVYQAIRALEGTVSPEIAEALYVSFVTDTGHFRFPKTTPAVHRIVADLLELGSIDPYQVYRAVFEGAQPGLNRLIGYALSDTHYEYGGKFAWAQLTQDQLRRCDGFDEDTGDLVNMLLSVEGVEAAAVFKELPDGATKVSLRSRGDVDVNILASRFGGGGHKNAAGILMARPLAEGVRDVVNGMRNLLQSS